MWGTRLDFTNEGKVDVVETQVPITVRYWKRSDPNNIQNQTKRIHIGIIPSRQTYSVYFLNECPSDAQLLMPRSAIGKLIGEQSKREFDLIISGNAADGVQFGSSSTNWTGDACGNEPAAMKVAPEDQIVHFTPVNDTDPRVYVEVADTHDSSGSRETTIKLHNAGGDAAHRVQIQPLTIGTHGIQFPTVDTILKDKHIVVRPHVETDDLFNRHNLIPPLSRAWAEGVPTTEHLVSMEIRYWNVGFRQEYATSFSLVYFPIQEGLRQSKAGRWPHREYKILEVRDTEIKRRTPTARK